MILIQNFITFILIIRLTSATLSYCSSQNTGSQLVNSSIYQSNGLCHDKCNQEGFALAIVQYQDCWCSNYVPGNTIDVDECNMNCPGFPSEKCGGDDLYGYIYLNQPSGTVGGSSSTTSSSTSTSPSTSTSTSTTSSSTSTSTTSTSSTSTSSSTSTTSSSTSPSSSFIQPTTSSTSSSTSSSTWSPPTPSTTSASPSSSTSSTSTTSTTSSSTTSSSTSTSSTSSTTTSRSTIPITTSETTSSSSSSAKPISTPVITSVVYSISTVTGGKQTQYVTTGIQTTISISTSQDPSLSSSDSMARATGVTPTADNSGKNNDDNNDDSFFDSKGKVAGVFTAVGVVGVVILSLLLWVLTRCLRNKKDYDDEDVVGVEGFQKPMNNGPKGFVTKTNILHEDEFNEVSSTDDTVINEKQHSNANSMKQKTNGNGNGNNGHKKNLSIVSTDFGTPIIDNHGDSTYVDQRLDVGTFSNIHERDEVLSLNDNEDYSRKVLRVTNP